MRRRRLGHRMWRRAERAAPPRQRRLGGGNLNPPGRVPVHFGGRWRAACGGERERGEILRGAQALAAFTKRLGKAERSGTSETKSPECGVQPVHNYCF
jgi:hypothetical protein